MTFEEIVLQKLRQIDEKIALLNDKIDLYSPPGGEDLIWSCGHTHASRYEATLCAQNRRRDMVQRRRA